MDLLLGQVANAGLVKAEIITLGATRISGQFILASLVTARGKLRRGLRLSYWLPEIDLKAKDTVVVHSGRGKNTREPTEDGHTRHHIYLNQRTALWGSKRRRAVLLRISEAQGLKYHPTDPVAYSLANLEFA